MFSRQLSKALPVIVLAAGVMDASLAQGSATQVDLRAHCACIVQTGERFNPFDDYESEDAGAMRSDAELRWWRLVEYRYGECMKARNAKPHDNPFPYGVSGYPGGAEFRPRECAGHAR